MNALQSSTPVRSSSFDIHRVGGNPSGSAAGSLDAGPSAAREQLQVQWLTNRVNGTVARDPGGFRDAAQLAFGDKADPRSINALIDAARSDALPIPPVSFVDPGALGANVNGAWDGQTIYLDRSLMDAPVELERVFTEELGHSLDTRLGGTDAAGDEGDVFARTLLGEQLSPRTLTSLRAENDHSTIEPAGLHDGPRAAEFNSPSLYDRLSTAGHIGLSGLGAVPVFGAVADGVDFAWTAAEMPFGKSSWTDLTLAGAGIVATVAPVAGDGAAATAKVVARLGKDGARNRALHEVFVDGLRADMQRPAVTDRNLDNILGKLYRENATIGSGSSAAAVRHERATGEAVKGKFHTQKVEDSIRTLEKWMDKNPTARPGDRAAAENVVRDMRNALGGR